MCGIVGVYTTRGPFADSVLHRMTGEIAHRGPDDEGLYLQPPIGLAMRRLSIIDIPTGHQPIANEDETCWIVFNGEIYNYRELRPELERRGHRFRTQSDTETILHQYEESGDACVQRFNGMFAFAIWDAARRRLFLARDRLGIKPLYYWWDGFTLVFASEIKAILASGLVPRELDPEGIWNYLSFRYVPAPGSIWQGVRKLPPGHTLSLDLATSEIEVREYWDLQYPASSEPLDERGDLAEFSSLFLNSVRRRLIADVPVGIFLSGGLDSGAVAAAVHEVHNSRLSTFSVAFREGGEFSELRYARQVAEHFGTEHHEVVIGLDEFMKFLPTLVWHTDEPLADPAAVPLYFVSRLAAERVKVVLSGEGGDEVLGGYTFDERAREWDRLARFHRLPRALRHTLPAALCRLAGSDTMLHRVERRNLPLRERNLRLLPYMTKYFSSAEKRELWPDAPAMPDSDCILAGYYRRANTPDPLHQMLYAYSKDWLVEDLLMKADKMTMAASLELRVPFLDYRLVEWLMRRPAELKVRRDGATYTTKYLLRRFAAERLPRSILERPKQGFPVPLASWMQGRLGEFARESLLGSDGRLARRFSRPRLAQVVDRGTRGAPRADVQKLWLLLILELWARRWG